MTTLFATPPAHAADLPLSVTGTTLRAAGAVSRNPNLLLGATVNTGAFPADPAYDASLATEFNSLTPENAMKWAQVQPAQDVSPTYEVGDAMVAFAKQENMKVRGHVLTWGNEIPSWVTALSSDSDKQTALHNHITSEVGHFKGKIAQWDVVNEALTNYGTVDQSNPWYVAFGGQSYIADSFIWAHQSDPSAALYYNDFMDEDSTSQKGHAMYNLVKGLIAAGAPIDGVGLQMHQALVGGVGKVSASALAATFKEFAGLKSITGKPIQVAITEMDDPIPLSGAKAAADLGDPTELAAQATDYQTALHACLTATNCSAFTVWGVNDLWAGADGSYEADLATGASSGVVQSTGAAVLLDVSDRPKPAMDALVQELASS